MEKIDDQKLKHIVGGQGNCECEYGIECSFTEIPLLFGWSLCTSVCYDLEGNLAYIDDWFCGPL